MGRSDARGWVVWVLFPLVVWLGGGAVIVFAGPAIQRAGERWLGGETIVKDNRIYQPQRAAKEWTVYPTNGGVK